MDIPVRELGVECCDEACGVDAQGRDRARSHRCDLLAQELLAPPSEPWIPGAGKTTSRVRTRLEPDVCIGEGTFGASDLCFGEEPIEVAPSEHVPIAIAMRLP